MAQSLLQMMVLMLLGASWKYFTPNQLSVVQTRLVITTTIYYFFLPAMVLLVLWQAKIGLHSLKISAIGCSSMVVAVVLTGMLLQFTRTSAAQVGAIILAAGFPNVTYLGLPVLEQTYGPEARAIVIQMDLFAAAPLVFSLGIAIARHYGDDEPHRHRWQWLLSFNTPPFWAMMLAVLLSRLDIVMPQVLASLLQTMANAVAPLMIFALGLALSFKGLQWRYGLYLVVIVVVKLWLQPYWAIHVYDWLDASEVWKGPAILDIAMPSMVLGIVLCDRYHLDSELYAISVTVTTLAAMLTLPIWYEVLQ